MRALAVAAILTLLLSCRGVPPQPSAESKVAVKVPTQLILEREISGRILAYDLKHPAGLALGPGHELFISDAGNYRLIKLDSYQNPVCDYGSYGNGTGRFNGLGSMVLDRGLSLYVIDGNNRRIIQMDRNLNFVSEIVPENAPDEIVTALGKLSGLQISSLGELIVADYDNSRLIRLDNLNRFSRYIGDFNYGQGALLNPLGIAVDARGLLYVADAGNGRIAVFDDYGNYLLQFGKGVLERPAAVAVSPDGIVWVGDQKLQSLFAFTLEGKLLMKVGQPGREDYQFDNIEAIAIDRDGYLFVADSNNDRILIYRILYEGNPQ